MVHNSVVYHPMAMNNIYAIYSVENIILSSAYKCLVWYIVDTILWTKSYTIVYTNYL